MPEFIAAAALVALDIGATTAVIGSITALQLATAAVTIAATAGLAIAQAVLTKSQNPALSLGGDNNIAAINNPAITGSEKQATPTQRILYGVNHVGGAVYFLEVKPPFLYLGLLLSRRRVTEILGVTVGSTDVSFGIAPEFGQILAPVAIDGQPNYPGRLQACFQDGSPGQPLNPLIAAGFPAIDATFRLPGIANVVFRFDYGADYNTTANDSFVALWGNVQIPAVLITCMGCGVYDPRDPTQRLPIDPNDKGDYWSAEATWKATSNATLIAADWAWQSYGLRAGPQNMDWDRIAVSADRDDEMVACLDGTQQRRYTADGMVQLDQQPSTVMDAILTANGGTVVRPTGKVGISSSRVKTPVFTIRDEHFTRGFTFTAIKGRRNLTDTVRTRFIDPTQAYQQVDGPVTIRADLVDADGSPLEATITLPFTSDYRRAERLAKLYLDQSRLDRSLPCSLDLRALGLEEDDIINVDSDFYSAMNGTYEIQDWALDLEKADVTFTLAEYDATIPNAWNPNADEQPFVLTPQG